TAHLDFFHGRCLHHDLLSFPTRRSSDLGRRSAPGAGVDHLFIAGGAADRSRSRAASPPGRGHEGARRGVLGLRPGDRRASGQPAEQDAQRSGRGQGLRAAARPARRDAEPDRAAAPRLPLAAVTRGPVAAFWDSAEETGAQAAGLPIRTLSDQDVDRAGELRLDLNVWTLNETELLRRAADVSAHSIPTDDPAWARRVLEGSGT